MSLPWSDVFRPSRLGSQFKAGQSGTISCGQTARWPGKTLSFSKGGDQAYADFAEVKPFWR
jgi:hypothetical protein